MSMLDYTRRDFLKTAGLAAAQAAIGAGALANRQPAQAATRSAERPFGVAQDRPNILFILTDDHAMAALSCYGSRLIQTTNLDRLAQEGMRFNHACVTMSLCSPSRASILTGKYGHKNGQVEIPVVFDGSQPTFPKMLRSAGYETAIVGKWHLHSDPTGFDYWNVIINQGSYFDPEFVENGVLGRKKGYVTDLITESSLDWLKKKRDKNRPFCLLCHHKAPHYKWEPDDKHSDMYKDVTFPEPANFNDPHKGRISPREAWANIEDMHLRFWKEDCPKGLSPQQAKKYNYQRFMRNYLRVIVSVDESIGRLLDYIDRAGLAENTIVIYMSDNGMFMGEHGWHDKRFMYEESLHIPLLVRYPKAVKPGSVSDDFVLNVDFAPTLLDYAGIPVPEDIQGRSFRPLLEGKTPGDWRQSIYYQYYVPRRVSQLAHYGVRSRRYKLIHFFEDMDDWELYDLEKDPKEMRNVYNEPGYADAVRDMKAELARLRKQLDINSEIDKNLADKYKGPNVVPMDLKRYYQKQRAKWAQNAKRQ